MTPSHTRIIGELGINHNGDRGRCSMMIEELYRLGADGVKLQIVSKETNYNLPASSPLLPAFQQSDLGSEGYGAMVDYCQRVGITPYASAADIPAAELCRKLDVAAIKISSSNLTNRPLQEVIASIGKPVICSTGSASLEEIRDMVVFFQGKKVPITVLHCISTYPASMKDLSLNIIPFLRETLQVPVGFSDHTKGTLAGAFAVMLGAGVLEKHFTLDHALPGPDHAFSLTPEEMREYVTNVRMAESSMGEVEAYFSDATRGNPAIRRAIVPVRDLGKHHTIQAGDVIVARPNSPQADAVPPKDLPSILGKQTAKPIPKWDAIRWEHLLH